MAGVGKALVDDFVDIADAADGGDCEGSQVGADQQGLGIHVGNAADAAVAPEVVQVLFELGAEGGVLDGVDLATEAMVLIEGDHTCATGAQVRVVVDAEENVQCDIAVGYRSEETAQNIS